MRDYNSRFKNIFCSCFFSVRGQGLMEMIVAIGIITMGLTTILALAASGLSGAKESEARTVALSLGREGVEVVRHIRDSNWLGGIDWDNGLDNGTADHTAIAYFDEGVNSWGLIFEPDGIEHPKAQFYLTDGVLYIQGENTPTGKSTFYRRLLTLDEICEDDTECGGDGVCESGESCTASEKVGIRVISRVEWTEHKRKHSMVVEDRLYNWK